MPVSLRWSRTREEWISCYCCPPNVARIVAQANTYAYGRSERGVWVHLFGGSTLDTTLPDGRRVYLECARVGCRLMTSQGAVARFISAQNNSTADAVVMPTPVRPRREKQIAEAEKALRAAGV